MVAVPVTTTIMAISWRRNRSLTYALVGYETLGQTKKLYAFESYLRGTNATNTMNLKCLSKGILFCYLHISNLALLSLDNHSH